MATSSFNVSIRCLEFQHKHHTNEDPFGHSSDQRSKKHPNSSLLSMRSNPKEDIKIAHNHTNTTTMSTLTSSIPSSLFLPHSPLTLIQHLMSTTQDEDEDDEPIESLEHNNIIDQNNTSMAASPAPQPLLGPRCEWPRPKSVTPSDHINPPQHSPLSTTTPAQLAPRCAWPRSRSIHSSHISPPSLAPVDGPRCAWPRATPSLLLSSPSLASENGPMCTWPRVSHSSTSIAPKCAWPRTSSKAKGEHYP